MKIYVQWSTKTPKDWGCLDSAEWPNIPKGSVPVGSETLSEQKLWIHSINVQGVEFHSFDHYAFIGNKVAVWCDDLKDWQDDRWGQIWTFNDPCPDPRINNRINTKQSYIFYADKEETRNQVLNKNIDILEAVKPFSEFPDIEEKYIGHGIWVPDDLNEDHLSCRSTHGWREWIIND